MDLPEKVLQALREKQKIRAIKLLREEFGTGLKEAKTIIDSHLSNNENIFPDNKPDEKYKAPGAKTRHKYLDILPGALVIITFVWAMINLVEVTGSIIILWNHDNYRPETFIITRIHYDNDPESGLTWGFTGELEGEDGEYRMYAPKLANAKRPGYKKLREIYPESTKIKVLYNPDVTDTLFQHRTLHIIPYTKNIVETELQVLYRWIILCLLPFAAALFFARKKNDIKK